MRGTLKSLAGRLWAALVGLLPSGGIGDDGPPPDIDGRRDADADYRRRQVTAKSQLSPHGQGATSYEPVDRHNAGGG